MPRTYNDHSVELLAPAGTLEVLKALLDSGADAFYLGGKSLNMRLHRKDLNFTDRDLVEGRKITADRGLGYFVTVNKLLGADDIESLGPYLDFLAERVRPDAVLVQDLAVAALIRERKLPLTIHASVMANVHNEDGARAWQALGARRVVLSRESSLADARNLRDRVGIEIEYFVHGDICIAHGSQCLYSDLAFGLSSNRGACMKPCRWPFSARWRGREYPPAFPLAVRDMNLHGHIPELLDAGVCSFKIEGRMRDAAYLRRIVETYADALDRFLENPSDYDRTRGADRLLEQRKRDFTTAYALGRPGPEILNTRWEGTGRFYSTGRVFSEAVPEPPETPERVDEISAALEGLPSSPRSGGMELAVRVEDSSQAELAWESGADVVILSGEPFRRTRLVPSAEDLGRLKNRWPTRKLAVQLPRMMDEDAARSWEDALGSSRRGWDELYIGYLGADDRFRALGGRIVADTPTNILNSRTAAEWTARGASLISVSLEAGKRDFCALVGCGVPVEVTVHGRITAMFMENDAYRNVPRGESQAAVGPSPFPEEVLCLTDALGQPHPVLNDAAGRSHLLTTRSLRLWALVPDLARIGVPRIRIETTLMSDALLASTIRAYRARMEGGDAPPPEDRVGWTLGALAWN